MGPSTVGMMHLKHNPSGAHFTTGNNAANSGAFVGTFAGAAWFFYESTLTMTATTVTTTAGVVGGLGLAVGGLLVSPLVGVGVCVGAQYSKNYLTRYPQQGNDVYSCINKLERLHHTKHMYRLQEHILKNYQPG